MSSPSLAHEQSESDTDGDFKRELQLIAVHAEGAAENRRKRRTEDATATHVADEPCTRRGVKPLAVMTRGNVELRCCWK